MKLLALLFVVAAVSAEIVDIKNCDGVAADKCTIHEIRITPCKNKNACRLITGQDAEISFDYTPHFNAEKLSNSVTWNSVAWDAIDSDACTYTPCPVQDDKRQTYTANMHIGKKLPEGRYEFRWSISDASNTDNACCFRATVQLKKPRN